MIPAGPLFHKPKSFISAKNLLYASICIGAFTLLLHKFFDQNINTATIVHLILIGVEYITMFLLVKQMGLCQKWARAVSLVVVILITATYIIMFEKQPVVSMAEVGLFVLQAIFQLVALIFLYKEESNTWFNSRTGDSLP